MDEETYSSAKKVISALLCNMANLFSLDGHFSKLLQESFGSRSYQEKTDRVLEPLQAMIQLALLSYCPLGTKLCVNDNLLSLQLPTLSQGAWRWFNKDSKEDLYFLFNAVKRYYMWYKCEESEIFKQILDLAKKGISKLIETYKKADNGSIIHTLGLYRTILEISSLENIFVEEEDTTMNTIFKKVKCLYSDDILLAVSSVFELMEREKNITFRKQYFEGLQLLLCPLNQNIQQWIQKELLCS